MEEKNREKVRALGLISGGLDSMLAVKVLQEQGIEVTGLTFKTPFFGPSKAQKAAKQLDIPLIVRDISEEHLAMVKDPKHGYGKATNPCIDCHAMMVKTAWRIAQEEGFDFVFTGEVLNERPMSQNQISLAKVEKESGAKGFLLRPLSAKLLDETDVEKRGVVDRAKLLDLHGRGRVRQFELAAKYNLSGYENPAGGCLLTDRIFGEKLKELLQVQPDATVRDAEFLRYGRHFRLSKDAKLIVGRDQRENELLKIMFDRSKDILISAERVPGPIAILVGENLERFINEAAKFCAAYSDASEGQEVGLILKYEEISKELQAVVDNSFRDDPRKV